MTKTIWIEGMMCAHCVSHVQKALLALEDVEIAEVFLADGKAVVRTAAADEVLRAAVTNAGYTVTRIEREG